MRFIITGGAGFIGSHLADRLLAEDHHILVIDNFSTGRRDNLARHARLEVVEATIADEAAVRAAFDHFKPEVVIHAAAAYKDPNAFAEDVRTNVLGTVHVLEAAKATKVQRIVYFQTSLCYGLRPQEHPITLAHPIRPEGSSYAYSKTAAEQYLDLSGIPLVTFRLANAYGPRNLSGPLPTFYHRLSTGKSCFVSDTRRDFVYIDDLIDCVKACIDRPEVRGAYHISSGSDFAISELFAATVKAMGLPADTKVDVRARSADDVATLLLDPSRTNKDLAWRTRVSLEEGVRRAIEWYRGHEITATYTHLKVEPAKAAAATERH
jgi:UDP-glucose 4-epimerase